MTSGPEASPGGVSPHAAPNVTMTKTTKSAPASGVRLRLGMGASCGSVVDAASQPRTRARGVALEGEPRLHRRRYGRARLRRHWDGEREVRRERPAAVVGATRGQGPAQRLDAVAHAGEA